MVKEEEEVVKKVFLGDIFEEGEGSGSGKKDGDSKKDGGDSMDIF